MQHYFKIPDLARGNQAALYLPTEWDGPLVPQGSVESLYRNPSGPKICRGSLPGTLREAAAESVGYSLESPLG